MGRLPGSARCVRRPDRRTRQRASPLSSRSRRSWPARPCSGASTHTTGRLTSGSPCAPHSAAAGSASMSCTRCASSDSPYADYSACRSRPSPTTPRCSRRQPESGSHTREHCGSPPGCTAHTQTKPSSASSRTNARPGDEQQEPDLPRETRTKSARRNFDEALRVYPVLVGGGISYFLSPARAPGWISNSSRPPPSDRESSTCPTEWCAGRLEPKAWNRAAVMLGAEVGPAILELIRATGHLILPFGPCCRSPHGSSVWQRLTAGRTSALWFEPLTAIPDRAAGRRPCHTIRT